MEIGFKGFDKDLCCRGVRYIPGATMPRIKRIKLCKRGYHFCRELKDLALLQWYKVDRESGNRFAVVEAGGVIHDYPGKSVAQEIRIIREMPIDEVLSLLDCSGGGNHGVGNAGSENTGNMNMGDKNMGSWNIGSCNNGICNSWQSNNGSFNYGDENSGCFNMASGCVGWFNTVSGCHGVFNQEGYRGIKISSILWELVYGWRNYAPLTRMELNPRFSMDRLCMKSMEKSKEKMYTLEKLDMKTVIRQGVSRIIADHAEFMADPHELKTDLMAINGFDWDIFEEITGISEKWLDMEIEKAIEAR